MAETSGRCVLADAKQLIDAEQNSNAILEICSFNMEGPTNAYQSYPLLINYHITFSVLRITIKPIIMIARNNWITFLAKGGPMSAKSFNTCF